MRPGVQHGTLDRIADNGAGAQAQAFGAAAHRAAPDRVECGCPDNTGQRAAIADDGDIDGKLVTPGNELARTVERIHQDERVRQCRQSALRGGFLRDHRETG
jgi:hypothetical protein